MNQSYFEVFLAVVECKSVSRAAEKLFLSQSTVSHRLKMLENEIGCLVNNSGFWIFTSLYGFDTKQGLKYFTTTNALGGIVAFAVLAVLTMVGLVA